jgi:hypothetical protein
MNQVQKGRISGIRPSPTDVRGFSTTARVVPDTGGGTVTGPIVIPWRLRNGLKPGDEVVFAVFDDRTGYIFDRANGEFA